MRRGGDPAALGALLAVLALWYGLVLLAGGGAEPGLKAKELEASRRMAAAIAAIRDEAGLRGIPIDPALDPNRTGLVGLPFSRITTTLGSLAAKRTGAQPDAAALVARLMAEAGLRGGDKVAIESSGSFPGFAVAALVAAKSLGAETACVASVGASTYGANRSEFTLPDMLAALARRGIIAGPPLAVSPGGADDLGADIDAAALDAALSRAALSGARIIREKDLGRDVAARRSALDVGRRPSLLVSIGGNWSATGTDFALGARSGILRPADFDAGRLAGTGLVQSYLADGVTVLRILDIEDLCARYGLSYDPIPWPAEGSAGLYASRSFPKPLVLAGPAAAIIVALLVRRRRRASD